MVVVTRWYGGIKLGAGGLVRAYGGAAAECLRDRAAPAAGRDWRELDLAAGFDDTGAVHAALAAHGAEKLDRSLRRRRRCTCACACPPIASTPWKPSCATPRATACASGTNWLTMARRSSRTTSDDQAAQRQAGKVGSLRTPVAVRARHRGLFVAWLLALARRRPRR